MSWHRDNNWGAIIRSCNLIKKQPSLAWCELATEESTLCIKTLRNTVLSPRLIRCMVRVCLMSCPWALLQWIEGRGDFSRLNNSWIVLCAWRTPSSTSLHILMRWWTALSRLPSRLLLVQWTSGAFAKAVCAFCSLFWGKKLRVDERSSLLVPLQTLIGIWQLYLAIRAGWQTSDDKQWKTLICSSF